MPQRSQYDRRSGAPSAGQDEMADFLHLIDLLHEVLVPVSPSVAFRAALGEELLAAGEARQEQVVARQGKRRLTSPWALLAAAVASAISVVVGIVTFILWHRTRPAAG